jgi:xanthine dehydrogenase accessory factor
MAASIWSAKMAALLITFPAFPGPGRAFPGAGPLPGATGAALRPIERHTMNEVSDRVRTWFAGGKRVVLATLVDTEGPSPRDPGAMFAVSSEHDLAGAISGGCVESTIVDVADAIFDGAPARRLSMGPDDDFDGGPTCGGTLHIVVQELEPAAFEAFVGSQERGEPFALAIGIDPPHALRVLHDDEAIRGCDERTFVLSYGPPPKMFVIGAVDVARPLLTYATALGFAVTIVDPRAPFAVPSRFPGADVLVAWPDEVLERATVDERDAIVSLAHDPKFDVPGISAALRTRAGYIGAMGSRGTTARRAAALREAGFTDDDLARLHAPIGLDLGARSPEEIALAVVAEIVKEKHGAAGVSLRYGTGPIRTRVTVNA